MRVRQTAAVKSETSGYLQATREIGGFPKRGTAILASGDLRAGSKRWMLKEGRGPGREILENWRSHRYIRDCPID
jgi:hypothetical protein